jgi:hypothetical protein
MLKGEILCSYVLDLLPSARTSRSALFRSTDVTLARRANITVSLQLPAVAAIGALRPPVFHGSYNVHQRCSFILPPIIEWSYIAFLKLRHQILPICAVLHLQHASCILWAGNGLAQTWTGTCWLNPPYGRQIGLWLAKAREAALPGATVVALIPARTDTK